jgi:ectoine hydroxylase-related dioxygenase (phytanoyl-CoA dioxygenase family)
MEARQLSGLVERFRRDGFVHVRGLLAAEEIAEHRSAVGEAVAVRKRDDGRQLHEKSAYEQSFIQCQYIWEDVPQVRALTFHEEVCRVAAALVGAERVRLWHDQALFKEPGGRETEAHQDQPYWPIAEADTCTAWIPMQPVDEQMGCMGYVPGSHLGERRFVDIFSAAGDGEALLAAQAQPAQFVPCQAGDVIFHHGYTVHLARANRSDQMRQVYTAIYFRDGCTRGGDRPHPSVDRAGIAPGELIDGAATPIAWPLPSGVSPTPEPWPELRGERAERAARLGIIPAGRT